MGRPTGPMTERDIVTAAEGVDGIEAIETKLGFDPPRSPERMVKFALGYLL